MSTAGLPALHPFDSAMQLEAIAPGRFRGQTEQAYWNMVGPFGGIVAATVMRAIMLRSDRVGDPLQLTVNFAGPMRAGEFEVTIDARRTNRTTQHWSVEIVQASDQPGALPEVVAIATATTATRRPVFSHAEARPPEGTPAPDTLPRLPTPRNLVWIDRYDMRYVRGIALAGAGGSSRSLFWVRDHPERAIDYPALAALADASLPRIFVMRPTFTPIATVSMNVYFHGDAQALARDGSGYLLMDSQSNVFDSGFFDQHTTIWTASGRLLVSTQQIVWHKG